jgi:hypothetical protein
MRQLVVESMFSGSEGDSPPRNHDREKFSFGFNLIWVVQSLAQKYSGSLLTQITCISLAIPAHTTGRFAIVTNVRSGCDGRGRRC